MKRENKVWERIAAVITVLLTLTVISCSNGSDVTPSTLQDLLSTTEKTTVDLSSEVFELSDSSSIVLSKAITLSGGASQYNLKGATLTVKSAGTIVENVTNVAELIIDESVGDGVFTLSNSSVSKLTVKGGGSNSIHLNGTAIATVTVAKEGVRLVLEGSTTVAAVDLQAACVLDSTSETAVISAVTIASSVKSVTLKGKANITAISASSKEVKVTVASNEVKVATTVVKASDGTVSTITMVPASEDIKVPETKLPEGEKEVEKKQDPKEEKKPETTSIGGITVTVVGTGDPLVNDEDRIDVTWAPNERDNNYIILKAPAGYSSYHWTFMGVTTVKTKVNSYDKPEEYEISFYPYSSGTYVAYLYVPDGEHVGKSATIYFDVNRQ